MNTSIEKIHQIASEISKEKWQLLKKKQVADDFDKYQNILCIFQTFNKSHLLKLVLTPFIESRFKNIILFADGCIDETISEAQAMLTGKRHAIIAFNDLHEIHNYRFAIASEWGRSSEFALLMQDDDLYPRDFGWLEYGLKMMSKDPKLVVIGFRSGINITNINEASSTFTRDTFEMLGPNYSLGNNIEGSFVNRITQEGKLDFDYSQIAIRAPHLIRIKEFLDSTNFDPSFEPFQDDDSNYCLELWKKGFRVGVVHGVKIARDIGIGGMRLSNFLTISNRPEHTKRNHNLLFKRYADFINSGECQNLVNEANKSIPRPPKKLLYL